jgi:hypothetical protein
MGVAVSMATLRCQAERNVRCTVCCVAAWLRWGLLTQYVALVGPTDYVALVGPTDYVALVGPLTTWLWWGLLTVRGSGRAY